MFVCDIVSTLAASAIIHIEVDRIRSMRETHYVEGSIKPKYVVSLIVLFIRPLETFTFLERE